MQETKPNTSNSQVPRVVSELFSDLVVKKLPRKSRESTLVGFGSVVIAKQVEARFTIRKKRSSSGLCINWPAHQSTTGKWYNDVKIKDREVRDALEEQILDAFDELADLSTEDEATEAESQ